MTQCEVCEAENWDIDCETCPYCKHYENDCHEQYGVKIEKGEIAQEDTNAT